MSKPTRAVYWTFLFLIGFTQMCGVATAQTFEADVEVVAGDSVLVRGKFADLERRKNPRSLAIHPGRTDAESSRMVTDLALFDALGQSIPYRTLMPGEFLAERDISVWSYKVRLAPGSDRAAAAHYSWLKDGTGILMWRDLMPTGTPASQICLTGTDAKVCDTPRLGEVLDRVNGVGPGWEPRKPGERIYTNGEWKFSRDELSQMTDQVYDFHSKLFRDRAPFSQMLIGKFPVPTPPGIWEAETRGSSVTILSSDMPFRSQSLQRLHEQLRHELFHLWIPNNVNLTGNYDWFYEGFALYQSLKMAVALNRIRFDDFLDTLSRAHTIDSAFTQRPSLVEASRNRSSGLNTHIYARGMLVAFLTDLALLESSNGSVEDLLRKIYAEHRKPAVPVDGNKAVTDLMKANPALDLIVQKYIAGSETIEWRSHLAAAGIEDADSGPITSLRVKEKPVGRQKTLLDKLGYNSWRKMSQNTR
jgi:hypothetical protein